MIRFHLLIIFLSSVLCSYSQDIDYARRIIDSLSSPSYDGRGYVNHGDRKAAFLIAEQFSSFNLAHFGQDYSQRYSIPMNTFPGQMEASMNGKPLEAGKDFVVWAASPTVKGRYRVVKLKASDMLDKSKLRSFRDQKLKDCFVLVDKKGVPDKAIQPILDSLRFTNFLKAKGLIFISDNKLSWSVMAGRTPKDYVVMDVSREAVSRKLRRIKIDIESRFIPVYPTQNMIGYIRGVVEPDSFLVFTAHYDHLGRMGKDVYFPGANDNASGTAMLLDLASYYSAEGKQPWYSIAFICLSGEETGLNGSGYYTRNPLFPLKQIKFLVNLDMVGTGSEGITMVNATVFKEAYERMVKINADHEYILTVKQRGESCNSDHCPFYQMGVPAVFIYSQGKEFTEYHNPDDKSSILPLTEYKDIFRLMVDFMDSFHK